MNDILMFLTAMELNRMGMFPDEKYRAYLNILSIAFFDSDILEDGKRESGDLIQHVGYDEAQCGREK